MNVSGSRESLLRYNNYFYSCAISSREQELHCNRIYQDVSFRFSVENLVMESLGQEKREKKRKLRAITHVFRF